MFLLENPIRLIVLAVGMMLFGCIVPFLMLPGIGVIESTLFMNILSYAVSALGLLLGTIGIATYQRRYKKKDDQEEWHE